MLKRFICYLVNTVFCLAYRNDYRKFIRITKSENSRELVKVQEEKLFQILRENLSCEYGLRYDFQSITSIKDFQKKVPLSTYEDYAGYIDRIRAGERDVLTSQEVLFLEPSSGSTSASKLIPYTHNLKKEFQKGIRPWLYDLYRNVPGIRWGQSYWSITPAATKKDKSADGVSIGFENDKEYFGRLESRLIDLVFAVPDSVSKAEDMDDFYYQTSVRLLNCPGLTLISVWNPSFLLLLLNYIEQNPERLLAEITLRNKRRAAEIKPALDRNAYAELWKSLKVISCWADAQAQTQAEQLKKVFPDVQIQHKGLLATEGFISFSLTGLNGSVLSVGSHFFEFESLDDGNIYLASELLPDYEYSVILTTSGGLYRYQLKDIITVTGFSGCVPIIKFIGKRDKVSDLFGEKLNERFVGNALESIGVKADFIMLAPDVDRYVLYIYSGQNGLNHKLAEKVDNVLKSNFHYDYCRRLGQLKPVRVFQLNGRPEREYLEECVKRGQRLGDIKHTSLHLQGGWDRVFNGVYL